MLNCSWDGWVKKEDVSAFEAFFGVKCCCMVEKAGFVGAAGLEPPGASGMEERNGRGCRESGSCWEDIRAWRVMAILGIEASA